MNRIVHSTLASIGVLLIASQALAQAPTSNYNSAITALNPVHYFPFNDPYASSPNAVVAADYGSSGGSGVGGGALNFGSGTGNNGTYVTTSGSANISNFLTNNTLGQLSSMGGNNKAIIGSNIGVAVVSQFVNYTGGSAGVISSQLPGFNPNYAYDNTSATNRTASQGSAFYADQRGGVILAATNSSFLGDPTTGAFTIAGWFLGAGQGTTSPNTRFFDDGQAGGDPNNRSFQLVGPPSSSGGPNITFETNVGTFSAGLSAWYPSGNANATGAGGDSNLYNGGQWQFIAVTFSGTDAATRFADFQVWDRDFMATQGMRVALGGNDGATNAVGLPKAGFRDYTPSTATVSASQVGAGESSVATWNRALAYDEIESLYIAGANPTAGPPVDSTLADGGWGDSSKWMAQTLSNGVTSGTANIYPTQHGGNNNPYYDVQINNNITAGGAGLGGYNAASQTLSFRSNMYRLTVSAASSASLTLQQGTTLRTSENMNLLGTVTMNGDGGLMSPDSWTASSKLDAGLNATIGSAAVITMNVAPASGGTNGIVSNNSGLVVGPAGTTPIGANAIVAEGNLTIQNGAQLALNASAYMQNNTTHAQLFTIAQANSALGDGASGLGHTGVLTGKFNIVGGAAALNNAAPADPLGRRLFVLYEGAAANGSGTVDSVKVGFARAGDATLDGSVDINDVGALGGSFNGPGNWRQGDFNNDGQVNVLDYSLLRTNYNTSYGPIVIGGNSNPPQAVLDYNANNGDVFLVAGGPIDGLTLQSASSQLLPAGWLGPNNPSADFFTGTSSVIGYNDFLRPGDPSISPVYDLGNILPTGLTEAQLQSDLTFNYFNQGDNTQYGGVVVPEPSTLALLVAGLGGFLARRRMARQSV